MTKLRHLSMLMSLGALMSLSACGGGSDSGMQAAAPQAAPPPPAAVQPAPAPAPAPAAPAAPRRARVTPAASPHVVREVQTVLRDRGKYQLAVDGRQGASTRLALRRWQHEHNIRPTGIIDAATLRSMNLQ